MDPSKQHERLRWEQIQAEVHGSLMDLQVRIPRDPRVRHVSLVKCSP